MKPEISRTVFFSLWFISRRCHKCRLCSVSDSTGIKWCVGKDSEGNVRGLRQGAVSTFACGNWGQLQNSSLRI